MRYWETIANRLYYAAYNAVSAMLVANGDMAQSHNGVIHMLGLKFIKTGILDKEIGQLYHKLFAMRLTGDYDDTYGLTEEDVVPLIEPTGKLIETTTKHARELLKKG